MKTTETLAGYGSLVAEAEKSVANVKDEKLREIAFSQVLSHLLSGGNTDKAPVAKTRGSTTRRQTAGADVQKKAKTKATGPKAWLRELVEEDFFAKPQALRSIVEELGNRSHHLPVTALTSPLEALCHEKLLRRKKMPPAEGKSSVYHWSNW